MGFGDLAAANPESKIPTPNLDLLAAQGMRFSDAHSSSGVCTPSRYALLTGRFHWRKFHGIVNSFGPPVLAREEDESTPSNLPDCHPAKTPAQRRSTAAPIFLFRITGAIAVRNSPRSLRMITFKAGVGGCLRKCSAKKRLKIQATRRASQAGTHSSWSQTGQVAKVARASWSTWPQQVQACGPASAGRR